MITNPGATEGLSDLPWHVDCGLGGHPVLCPTVNLGIQLDAANAAGVVPVSWRNAPEKFRTLMPARPARARTERSSERWSGNQRCNSAKAGVRAGCACN